MEMHIHPALTHGISRADQPIVHNPRCLICWGGHLRRKDERRNFWRSDLLRNQYKKIKELYNLEAILPDRLYYSVIS